MKRKSEPFTQERYLKDPLHEETLKIMNDCLADRATKGLGSLHNKERAIIILVGAPRAGTTLIYQYVSSYFDLFYPNNLIAKFFKAPLFGLELSKSLLKNTFKSSFRSNYGQTDQIEEPHEFGYFWNHFLKYEDLRGKHKDHENNIDWKNLVNILNELGQRSAKSSVYKGYLLSFHARRFYEEFDKVIFIHVKRSLDANITSLLKYRTTVMGDINSDVSIQPRKELPKVLTPFSSARDQILQLNKEYSEELSPLPSLNRIEINYEDFCDNPIALMNEIEDRLHEMNVEVIRTNIELPRGFTPQRR
jgi:hypothetical protein